MLKTKAKQQKHLKEIFISFLFFVSPVELGHIIITPYFRQVESLPRKSENKKKARR